MPELPEAENIARALASALQDRVITAVAVFSPRLRTPLAPLLSAHLEGERICGVRRRGRYVIVELSSRRGLLLHFGMSGVVRVEKADAPRRRHEHAIFTLDNGQALRFEDPRRFGLLECVPLDAGGLPPCLDKLGVEPLSDEFDADFIFNASRSRHAPVKLFITDNAVVTGIGNIYAAESLFAAGVDPRRPALSLTRAECQKLAAAVKDILLRSIAAGGSTISDYRHVDGTEGRFAQELQIYGRRGEKCPRCGTPVESVVQGGRSSFFCPRCQR